jgi:restriction endonuclease S subunit
MGNIDPSLPPVWKSVCLKDCGDVVTSSLSYSQLADLEDYSGDDSVEVLGLKVSDLNLSGNETLVTRANLTKRVRSDIAVKKAVPAGIVVFPKRGVAIATNKKRLTTTWTVFDPNLIGVKPGKQLVAEFVYFWFSHFDLRTITDPGPTPQLNKKDLEPLLLPVPPLPEQCRIARVLSTVQAAIGQQRQLIGLIQELNRALMKKFFTEGLRGEKQRTTDIGPVPESWDMVKIGALGKCVTGTTPKTAVKEYYLPAEYDFIAPADLGHTRDVYDSEKKVSGKGLETARALPKNAVMCVCIGSSIGKVGMTWKKQSATNQQINSIICDSKHDPKFVYYLLNYFCEYWRGFATFGPVPILNKGRFEGIDVPVPPTLDEQAEMGKLFSILDSKIEVHDKKKALLEELLRTLLHQLMTAQIRVDDLDLPGLSSEGVAQ